MRSVTPLRELSTDPTLLGGGRIDRRADLRNAVSGEAGRLGVLPDQILARRAVDAIDLIVGDVGMDPLDLGPELAQHAARALRGALQIVRTKVPDARHIPLDDELRHGRISPSKRSGPLRRARSRVQPQATGGADRPIVAPTRGRTR